LRLFGLAVCVMGHKYSIDNPLTSCFHNNAFFHHKIHISQSGNIVQWVFRDGDDIRQFSAFSSAYLVLNTQ
jgi:hypothetical protein